MINWFNHLYPYSNLHELNLDWLIETVKNLVDFMDEFVTLNTIKYANPIQWNITNQYEKNTVVIDPNTGTAYISRDSVPSGVGLNNTDYWNVIFTLDIISANKNITLRDDANNTLATFDSDIDDWLLSNGTLYKVIRHIDIGNAYVVGYNLERFTVEMYLKAYITDVLNTINTLIGDLDDLNTTDKTSIVNAINDVLTTINTLIGDLDNLNTTDKTSVVNAINDVLTTISTLIGNLSSLNTTDKTSVVNAINELLSKSGDLANLNTTNKSTLVNAINEVQSEINNLNLPRRMVLMGDSWATGFKTGIGYLTNPWCNQVKTFFGLSNDDCFIVRIDGASFTNSNPLMHFKTMLENASDTITNHDTITDIVVCAGNNEMTHSTSEIVSEIDSFASYCRNEYPNAIVSIGMIGGGKDTDIVCYDNVTRSSVYCFYEYSLKGYVKGAENNINCRYLNNVQYACRQNVYSYFAFDASDQHPDQAGQNVISKAIITALRNDECNVLGFTNSMSLTAGANVSVVTSAPWYNRLINNIVSIGSHNVTELTLQNVTSYTCDGKHDIELFNIGGGSIVGSGEGTQKYVLPCFLMDGNSAFYSANISIYFSKQKVYGSIICMGSSGWLNKTLASIWIPKFMFDIDSMTC